jgi:crotonobetainyl-CoA:carnitine CoA-transferase CaiB-like acyl-CoA transferase
MSNPPKPLAGVRVVDLSRVLAGPYCGQMLADMGAIVTKFEPPLGDFWRLSNMVAADESRGFISVNRGKRSISIDLKAPAGLEIVRRAVKDADVCSPAIARASLSALASITRRYPS